MPETTTKIENTHTFSKSKYPTKVDTSNYFWGTIQRSHQNVSKDIDLRQDIENLKQTYDFDLEQKEEIENFLRENKEIIQVLQDAKVQIETRFQNETLYIEYEDGEECEIGGELFLSIETKKDIDEALKQLRDFEDNWWTDKWIQINSKLSIDVRFIK